MSMERSYQITYSEERCFECGMFYMVETRWHDFCRCPRCAFQRTKEYRQSTEAAERKMNSLRGVITRMKKKP